MAANSNISVTGGPPQVTVKGTNLVRYSCHFFLWKPIGQTWPDTGQRFKEIHQVTLNKDHPPADTFSLGAPASLTGLFLTWQIDMALPGGVGGPLQYSVSVGIKQDGEDVLTPPWEEEDEIDSDPEPISGGTRLKVS